MCDFALDLDLNLDLPFIDEFRVNLKGINEACKNLYRPRVFEHILNVYHIHAKLIAKTFFRIKWDLTKDGVDLRDSLICHRDLWQVRVLKESIIWRFFFQP